MEAVDEEMFLNIWIGGMTVGITDQATISSGKSAWCTRTASFSLRLGRLSPQNTIESLAYENVHNQWYGYMQIWKSDYLLQYYVISCRAQERI